MRTFGTFILGILVAIAALILVIFAIENTRAEQFSFLGTSFTADLWLVAVIPAIVGFILALLLVTPARAGLDSQHRTLGRRYRDLDRQYGSIRQQHESLMSQHAALQSERDALHEEHTRLLAAHDDLRSRMAATSAERPTERVTEPITEPVTEPVRERMDERTAEPVVERVDARPRDRADRRLEDETVEERTTPDGAAVEEREVVHETAPEHRPSLGDRVRGWLRPERPTDQDYPNGPLAPTA